MFVTVSELHHGNKYTKAINYKSDKGAIILPFVANMARKPADLLHVPSRSLAYTVTADLCMPVTEVISP